MSSDSDQELDRCAEFCSETIRQRKARYDDESHHFGLLPDYSTTSLRATGSSSPDSDIHDSNNDKSLPEEIVLKHIRIPSDWDPVSTKHFHVSILGRTIINRFLCSVAIHTDLNAPTNFYCI